MVFKPIAEVAGAGSSRVEEEQYGSSFPAMPAKAVDKIHSHRYVDFSELPPARVRGKAVAQGHDSQMMRAKKVIADFETWSRCYDLFTLVSVRKDPKRWEDLLAYHFHVVDACARFGWPSWVAYDDNFREADSGRKWAPGDPMLFTSRMSGAGNHRTTTSSREHLPALLHT